MGSGVLGNVGGKSHMSICYASRRVFWCKAETVKIKQTKISTNIPKEVRCGLLRDGG